MANPPAPAPDPTTPPRQRVEKACAELVRLYQRMQELTRRHKRRYGR